MAMVAASARRSSASPRRGSWSASISRCAGCFSWALVLPLAVPPYLAAYAFAEFFLYTGPVQGLVRALFGFQTIRDYWFPDIRSTRAAQLSCMAVGALSLTST